MKNLVISFAVVALLLSFTACKQATPIEVLAETETPDYAAFDAKVAVISAFYKAYSEEDMETLSNMLSDTLQWSPPQYNGNQWLGKDDLLAALKNYHDNFEDIQWTAGVSTPQTSEGGYWSGSVFPEGSATSTPNDIRVYGTWNATHSETGKPTGAKFFSLITVNEEGKISSASDYFDVNGLAVQIAAE